MKQRIFSLLLVFAMVLGMLPTVALAEDSIDTVNIAAFGTVDLDGSLNEQAWLTYGRLSDGTAQRAFGTLWDSQNLYFAVVPEADDQKLTLKVNSKTLDIALSDLALSGDLAEKATVKMDSALEIQLPFSALDLTVSDYNQSVAAELALDDFQWKGNVLLSASKRTCTPTFSAYTGINKEGDPQNLGCTVDNGSYTMYDKYVQGAGNTNNMARVYRIDQTVPFNDPTKTYVVEFDFVMTKSPEVVPSYFSGLYAAHGFSFAMVDSGYNGFSAGIANTANGLVFCINGDGEGIGFTPVPLEGKTLGDQFHIRTEYSPEHVLSVYIDDSLLVQVEDPYINTAWGGLTNVLNFNLMAASDNHPTADGSNDFEFTFSNVRAGLKVGDSVLDGLTFDSIKGENLSADAVTQDLVLPDELPDCLIPDLKLTWSSSNEGVISAVGKVTPAAEDATVVLTAALESDPSVTKSFTVTVPRLSMDAYLADGGITVDGVMDENSWVLSLRRGFSDVSGDVSGTASVLWDTGCAYVGVAYENANSLSLTLGETTWELPLSATMTAEGVTGAASDGAVELKIDLEAAGIKLQDYNDDCSIQIELTGSNGSAKLETDAIALFFTGNVVTPIPAASKWLISGFTVDEQTDTIALSTTDVSRKFWLGKNAALDHTKDLYLEQTITAAQFSTDTGEICYDWEARGYYFWLSDLMEGDTLSSVTFANLYNSGTNGLVLRVRQNGGTGAWQDVPLGKQEGSTFVLGYRWNADNSVEVYVDGVLAGSVSNVTYQTNQITNDIVGLNYYNNSASQATLQITDLSLTVAKYNSVLDELTISNVLAGKELSGLTNDSVLTLPGTYTTRLGALELNWTSSDPAVALTKNQDGSVTATITQPEGKRPRYVDISLSVNGEALWSVEAEVLGTEPMGDQTSLTLGVPFTAAEVLIDGKTTDEGWNLNTNVLSDNTAVGKFGAQWNKENLYFAAEANGLDLSITVEGESVDLADAVTEDGITEAAVSLEDLGITVYDYGKELNVTVKMGKALWEGTLVLTSTDWFVTDGCEPRLPVAMKGTVPLGSSQATDNQGYEDQGNRWYLYDHYDPLGNNPSRIRTYLLAWGQDNAAAAELLAPMDDRENATYCEFDFLATSMPVYVSGSGAGGATDWDSRFASYGFTWSLSDAADEQKNSNSVSMGIYNTEDGLMFCALGTGGTHTVELNRQVGDQFRMGVRWEVDGGLAVYVDGEKIAKLENIEVTRTEYGNNSVIMNLIRNADSAKSRNDNFDIYISNLSLGKSRGDSIFDQLKLEDIMGENTDPYDITTSLNLDERLYDDQLDVTAELTWTSSHPDIIAVDGTVEKPEAGGKLVTLTASWGDVSKTFEFYVKGKVYASDVLVVENDKDTANGSGVLKEVYQFTLDENNNSIVLDLHESQQFNLITLNDGDASNRLNESVLTIWVSDDNQTFTRIENFKIKRSGKQTYLYDFEAEGRYVKVHCTHFDGTDADFIGALDTMLEATWLESDFTNETTVTVTNTTGQAQYDYAWAVSADGIKTEKADKSDVRFVLDGEILYHYYNGANFVVRIPEIKAGASVSLTALSGDADALDLSNKEYTHEVVYGTREAIDYNEAGRFVVEVEGRLFALDNTWYIVEETGETVQYLTYSWSDDCGMTWEEPVIIDETIRWCDYPGGVAYDPDTGRIMVQGYEYNGFVGSNMNLSDCKLRMLYSDDLGKTWNRCEDVTFAGNNSNYILSYTDPERLSTYDGAGEGVDYIFPACVQYDNNGTFCCRAVYTTDAGLTWTVSETEIIFEDGSGILAYEGGVSEGTIMENSKGELVLFVRCQYDTVNTFARSVSTDFGKTWSSPAHLSSVYTPNTQPIMYNFHGAQLLTWGGNNVLGGNSYERMPMNVAISRDDLTTFEGIQDAYSRYSMQGMTKATMNQITNQSVASIGDTMILTWGNNVSQYILRVENFTDWFYRTKGVYDSFENSTTKYEGWSTVSGTVAVSDLYAADGNYSMKLSRSSSAVRTMPYMQDGMVSFQLYLPENPSFEMELESAYSPVYGEAAPIGFSVKNGVLTFLGEEIPADITFKEGWNTFVFDLNLTAEEPKATLAVNGAEAVDVPVADEIGDYVCWLDLTAVTPIYVDDVLVVSDVSETAYEEAEVIEVNQKIASIGEVTVNSEEQIVAARAAYEALSDEQKALVTNLSVLKAAEERLASLKEARMVSYTLTLEDYIGINFYMHLSDEVFAQKDAYMLFTREDGSETKVPVDQCRKRVKDGVTTYGFTYYVAAKEMADVVKAQFFYNNGASSTEVYEYSVLRYAQYVIDHSDTYGEPLCQLVKDMLQYGAYAQLHFEYNDEDLANKNVTGASAVSGVTAETLSGYNITNEYKGPEGAQLYSTSLILEANTTLRFYFTVTDETVWNALTITLDGRELEKQHVGDEYYVDVTGIAAKNLHDTVTLTVSDSNESWTLKSSPMTYCYNVLSSSDDFTDYPYLQDLTRSLYLYNQAASNYFNS